MTASANLRPGIYTRNGSAWTPAPDWQHGAGPERFGYARVSTEDQHLGGQADRLADHIDVLFADKASGLKADRPYWDRLREAIAADDSLTATKLDRIGRSVLNLGEVAEYLESRGADLIVLDQKIDTRSSFGKFAFHMLSAMAEFERNLIVERTRDGQDSVRLAGNLRRSTGGATPLLGYVRHDGDDDWSTDETVAGVLRDMAARVLRGETMAAAFAEQPVIHDANGREVSERNLRAALQRPATAGLITGRDGAIFGPSGIASPPLDVATHYALADMFDGNKAGRKPTGEYPYGKVLECGKCGNQLTGGVSYWPRGSKTPIYQCKTKHPKLGYSRDVMIGGTLRRAGEPINRPCKGVSIVADDLHAVVRAAVEGWAATSDTFAGAISRQAELSGRHAELDAELELIRDRIADWTDKRDEGDVSAERYGQAMTRLRARRIELNGELSALATEQAHPMPAVIDWDGQTAEEQRRLIAEALEIPIVVMPGNGGARPLTADQRVIITPRGGAAIAA